MLNVRLSDRPLTADPLVLVLPVSSAAEGVVVAAGGLDDELRAQVDAFLAETEHTGKPGSIGSLPRPMRTPHRIVLVGVGAHEGSEAGWRSAGAAVARAAGSDTSLVIAMPAEADQARAGERVRGVAEGLWLASYRFRRRSARKPTGATPGADSLVAIKPDDELLQVTLLVEDAAAMAGSLEDAYVIATSTRFARDLTNMPSDEKSPEWFAGQISAVAAGNPRLSVRVRAGTELAEQGFGGITAVGSGSVRSPRLVELSWAPEGAAQHVVLIGKGITFDSGGISIKGVDGMALMRKDMGGAAAIMAATLGAAQLDLPVRITAIAPLAENMPSGSAFRPSDVVHHFGGMTSEILNTDAEGRVVLADALAYAAAELDPDYLIDLATLTGANSIALGKRTAALYTENDDLAAALDRAAVDAGEQVWRMPLPDDYVRDIRSEIADVANASYNGGGSITAALFLREFTGASRKVWAHLDMSAPSWAGSADGELAKGATGWGVRTLIRWLAEF